jgi:hypothetical protein
MYNAMSRWNDLGMGASQETNPNERSSFRTTRVSTPDDSHMDRNMQWKSPKIVLHTRLFVNDIREQVMCNRACIDRLITLSATASGYESN